METTADEFVRGISPTLARNIATKGLMTVFINEKTHLVKVFEAKEGQLHFKFEFDADEYKTQSFDSSESSESSEKVHPWKQVQDDSDATFLFVPHDRPSDMINPYFLPLRDYSWRQEIGIDHV
jgi:hypothetical protein